MTRDRRTALFGAALVLLLAAWVLTRLEVELDVSEFMFGDAASESSQLMRHLASGDGSRTLILAVEGPTTEAAIRALSGMERALLEAPDVAPLIEHIDGGPTAGSEEALWGLYQGRALHFVASSTTGVGEALSEEGLSAALRRLEERLRSPMSPLLSKVAPSDPLLVIPSLFERIAASERGRLDVAQGRYVAPKRRWALSFLRTRASALSGAAHAPLLLAIQSAFRVADAEQGGGLVLRMAGLHRFSAEIERSIKRDITRVSALSVAGLILLFLGLFRSLRVVALTFAVVLTGLVFGLAATLLAFGRVHGLTLAFGAALIGVSVDYSVHFFIHHTLSKNRHEPRSTLRRIAPAMLLSGLTTVLGFAGLAGSALPGLFEVSVFAAAGISGALLATVSLLPGLVSFAPPRGLSPKVAEGLGRSFAAARAAPRGIWATPLLFALGLTAAGLTHIGWDDDVARMTRLDPELVEEEEEVRGEVARFDPQRFVLAQGDTFEDALIVNERIRDALEAAVSAGELGGFKTLASFLPSARTQAAVKRAVTELPGFADRFHHLAVAHGFRAEAFAPFLESLTAPGPTPLRFEDLDASPLSSLIRSFRLQLNGSFGVLSFLVEVRDPDALRARLGRLENVRFFDRSALERSMGARFRERTVVGLSLGFLLVVALVFARHRRLAPSFAALVPASLSVGVTIAVLHFAGLALNLVGLTALLMVFSMGVDYGIFLVESRRLGRAELGGTLLALLVSWGSTLLGFGLLALSSHPAMQTIGLTASIGLTSCLLLAPTSLLLLRSEP